MTVAIDAANAAQGVLGLVVALAELIQEALEVQAIRRMDSGQLTDDEIERLGQALADLTTALARLKVEHDLDDTVQAVRGALDDLASQLVRDLAIEATPRHNLAP